ncbi:DUF6308 family protein [Arthrobacter sp. efr-133-TYG-120]
MGVGLTIASKILARKPPHLIPLWDKVIGTVVAIAPRRTNG